MFISAYLIVVGSIGEGQWQQTLFLQVGLVDASKRLHNDGASTQVTWLESGMLARGALAVVLITDGHPLDVVGLVVAGDFGHISPLASALVLDFVHLVVFVVGGANEHVVGNVVQMAAILQPGASGRNVICGALALNLDQHSHIGQILARPLVEWLQQLQTLRLGIYNNFEVFAGLLSNEISIIL